MWRSRDAFIRGLLVAAACVCVAPASADAAARHLSLRLIPSVVEGPGSAHTGPSPARGTVLLRLPAAWGAPAIERGDSVARLHIALAPQCNVEIEAGNGGIAKRAFSIRLEMEDAEDFWFELFAPIRPRPVPLVAGRVGQRSAWELATPPAGGSGSPVSPYYGTAAGRLGSTRVWGDVHIGVRAPPSCVDALPGRAQLQSEIESVLRTAVFDLHPR